MKRSDIFPPIAVRRQCRAWFAGLGVTPAHVLQGCDALVVEDEGGVGDDHGHVVGVEASVQVHFVEGHKIGRIEKNIFSKFKLYFF